MDNNAVPGAGKPANTPPPISAPPLLMSPPVIQVRRGGRGWMIIALLAVLLLVASHLPNLAELTGIQGLEGLSLPQDSWLEESVVTPAAGTDKVLQLDVIGVISKYDLGGEGLDIVTAVRKKLRKAEKDDAVKAVVLKVDSPGGEVLASDEIYEAVKTFQEKSGKPVVASMGSVAASGGYYVSAPCRWIVAHPLTITGSIGVIMSGMNYRGLMDKVGVRPQVYKSGKYKDMLSGMRSPDEIPEGESEMVQALITETYGRFKEVVREGRTDAVKRATAAGKAGEGVRPLAKGWETHADGRVFTGRQAFEHGFVDELGGFQDAVKRAQTLAGITEAKVVRYDAPFTFGNIFRILGQAESRVIKVDFGVAAPRLQPGLLYFLSPLAVH